MGRPRKNKTPVVLDEAAVEPAIRSDPNTGPTCVYKAGKSKVLTGVDVAEAYRDGWHDVPTDHPDSRENLKR